MIYNNSLKNELVESYKEKIKKGGLARVIRVAEIIVLRPNDQRLLMGEERFNAFVEAENNILEEYKDNDIYEYYHTFDKEKHGFNNFERWSKLIK